MPQIAQQDYLRFIPESGDVSSELTTEEQSVLRGYIKRGVIFDLLIYDGSNAHTGDSGWYRVVGLEEDDRNYYVCIYANGLFPLAVSKS